MYGVKGIALDWFNSYLTNRKQVCKTNNTISSVKHNRCGVPQGSNLGPLLFLVYINDLPRCLRTSTPAMYADDTNITVVGKTSEEIEKSLNSELENIHKWLLANKLTLNVNKTEYMIIGSRQKLQNTLMNSNINIAIGGNEVKQVLTTKSLGVIIGKNLC